MACDDVTSRTPFGALREQLAAARASGRDFTAAWTDAVMDALDGLPRGEFVEWDAAMNGTWKAWRDAYERRPSKLAELTPR